MALDITYVISSFLRSLAWSLGLGLGIEASPGNFFSSKFSRVFTGSFWKNKIHTHTHRQKPLGNPEKTIGFQVSGVNFEFQLKDLAVIPQRICIRNK
jgi:hypothetical protein